MFVFFYIINEKYVFKMWLGVIIKFLYWVYKGMREILFYLLMNENE